ncbi:hypothetical protein TELCIR_06434 [Teladorsagia circumcincta]|uniref:Uncharacterized protein n=1 Tax=Teladorsagia circumcincta TaxID=45464 RepID=A0A2G9UPM2_TELCI|nr:hypothetical protein TELCIR_06434 [Teladorsagia circumcincta]
MTCFATALCASILLMVVCTYHWLVLKRVYRQQHLRKMQQVVKKAKRALQCGKNTTSSTAFQLTAVEIAVLASQAGMTLEQVEEEYRRDSQARKDVLMSVLGDSENPFVRKFIQHYPSRFLSSGYDLEEEFLHNKNSEREADLRQIRNALGKK